MWVCVLELVLRKQKKKLAAHRLEKLSEESLNFDDVKNFVENKSMWARSDGVINELMDNEDVSDDDVKFVMACLMITVLFKLWQRPGAALNCTVEEFLNGTLSENIFVVSVREHKTGTYGCARLMFDSSLLKRTKLYQGPNCLKQDEIFHFARV